MKIKNTLKTLGLLLTLNINAADTLNVSNILVEKKSIETIRTETKSLEDAVTEFNEKVKEDDKLKFEYTGKIQVKNGDDKTEEKEFELKDAKKAEEMVKELNTQIKLSEAGKDSDERAILQWNNFKVIGTYMTPELNDKKEYTTSLNMAKTLITTSYVVILGVASYFGYKAYNNNSAEISTEIQ